MKIYIRMIWALISQNRNLIAYNKYNEVSIIHILELHLFCKRWKLKYCKISMVILFSNPVGTDLHKTYVYVNIIYTYVIHA